MNILNYIKEKKIIAIVRGIDNERLIDTANALYSGGVRCMEVTFNQSDPDCVKKTYEAIALLNDTFEGKLCVGAGTVMTKEQLKAALDARAKYIISPHTDIDIIEMTKEASCISMPGAYTPSEIVMAYKYGADIVKLFPAGHGGISYLKSIKAPISHIPLFVVGGVNIDNLSAFLKAGASGVGIGSNLVDKKLIDSGEYEKLTELASSFTELIEEDSRA